MPEAQTFKVHLQVRPRDGVRDPQADAVQQALGELDYQGTEVEFVGRAMGLRIVATDAAAAREQVHSMCRRLLVNPNLETYDLTVAAAP